MPAHADVIILGAGLAGLAAASELGDRAMVLEREGRPGGLVRTEHWDGYWFDHVLHLLHFGADRATEARVLDLVGRALMRPTAAEAWVETAAGVVRYPLQSHLHGLAPDTVARCLTDLARVTFGPAAAPADSFAAMLLQTFGRGLCETFLFPYNRKMWRRPLESLAPSGFQWNLARPDFAEVVRGALGADAGYAPYNAHGWYPVPPPEAPVRGMEVVARALAREVNDLRLCHDVRAIDLERRAVHARTPGGDVDVRYGAGVCSTLPLPVTVAVCEQAPSALRERCRRLVANRVCSIAFSIRGPRPSGRGLWRYYADESLCFTRLVYPHLFDPGAAPAGGFGLLAEVPQRAEEPPADDALVRRCEADVVRAGALPPGCEIVDRHVLLADPAYVVFTPGNRAVMEEARAWLRAHGVEPLGRYGRWEYSSMAQVMRDGFAWGAGVQAGAAVPGVSAG